MRRPKANSRSADFDSREMRPDPCRESVSLRKEKFREWNLLGGTIYSGVNSLSCLSNAA